jgi:hypothetical protein
MRADAELSLTAVRFGREGMHLLLPVQGPRGTWHLLLDTGATHSILHRDALPEIADPGSAPGAAFSGQPGLQITGLQGSLPTALRRLRGLRAGPVPIPPSPWGIADLSDLRAHYRDLDAPPPDGLLGCDLLHKLGARIDLEHHTLSIRACTQWVRGWQRGLRLR